MNVKDLVKGREVFFVKYKWGVFTYGIEFDGKTLEFPVKQEWIKEDSLLPRMNANTDFWIKVIKNHLNNLY